MGKEKEATPRRELHKVYAKDLHVARQDLIDAGHVIDDLNLNEFARSEGYCAYGEATGEYRCAEVGEWYFMSTNGLACLQREGMNKMPLRIICKLRLFRSKTEEQFLPVPTTPVLNLQEYVLKITAHNKLERIVNVIAESEESAVSRIEQEVSGGEDLTHMGLWKGTERIGDHKYTVSVVK